MISNSTSGGPAAGADDPGTCYLIHFDRRYEHAGHYLGWTPDLDKRLAAHREGRGARLMEVITAAGIGWHVARTWTGGRTLERALKDQHAAPRLCPDCTPHLQPLHRAQTTATPAAPPATPPAVPRPKADPYERGAQMATRWLDGQAARTAEEIAATHHYITGPWREAAERHTPEQAATFRGYQETVARHLAKLSQADREADEMEAGS